MRRRLRHHVNPLSLAHLQTDPHRLPLPTDRRVEVELGCAEGDFLFERATVRPDGYYVGVEIRRRLAEGINDRAKREGLPQIRAVYANLITDLKPLFARASVDAVHVLFPDPWFKKRHKKRRFLGRELALQAERILKPSGSLFVQSDIFELALDALATLESMEGVFSNRAGPWRFARENPFGARSRRERRCLRASIPIWRLLFERVNR